MKLPHGSPRSPALFGFRTSLGITLSFILFVVVFPLVALIAAAREIELHDIVVTLSSKRTLAAVGLSFGAALIAAVINTIFGTIVAWVLARFRFAGRSFLDAVIDLPFALPTSVGGIALTSVYSKEGFVGRALLSAGIPAAYSRIGVVIALVFVGLPFVVRAVGPVIENLDRAHEEAALMLGASRWTTFRRVIFPAIAPAALTGFSLSFARGLGEYGSVVFISGNLPFKTEVVPFLIMAKLEEFDYRGATTLSLLMLAASLSVLFVIGRIEDSARRRSVGDG